jgi:hypothetical protein
MSEEEEKTPLMKKSKRRGAQDTPREQSSREVSSSGRKKGSHVKMNGEPSPAGNAPVGNAGKQK